MERVVSEKLTTKSILKNIWVFWGRTGGEGSARRRIEGFKT